jgi:hypothetical protein
VNPEVDHGLLGTGPEVVGLGLERREHRHPGFLTPPAVLIGLQAQEIAIPRVQGHRVGSPHEVSTDPKHTFHVAIMQDGDLQDGDRAGWHHTVARFTPPSQPRGYSSAPQAIG